MKPNKNQYCSIEDTSSHMVATSTSDFNNSPLMMGGYGIDRDFLDGQLWMFVPLNNDYYAIVNKLSGKVANVSNNSMKEGDTIGQLSWENGDSQQWFLHDLGDGNQRITSKLSGYVWDAIIPYMKQMPWNGGNTQKWAIGDFKSFTLPSIQTYPLAPPPNYKDINEVLPDRTEMVTTNYTLAPCIAISDPQKNDLQKIQTNPYYLYVRKQYWRKVGSHVLAPGTAYGYKQTSGMTMTDQNTVTNTVSHSFGADVGLSFGNRSGKKSLSAALSYQYTNELSVQESHTETELTVLEEAFTIENKNDYQVAWTKYISVSVYHVQRVDGTIVNEPWTVTDYHNTYDCFYPLGARAEIVDKRVSVDTNETIFD